MTSKQVIEGFESLSTEEKKEVAGYIREHVPGNEPAGPKYMHAEKAQAVSEEIFKDHSELFKKLAQ